MTISKFIRKTLMFVMNSIKFISIILGSFGILFFVCGLDSEGKAGTWFFTGLIISTLLLIGSVFNEIFVVKVLLKKNERLTTIFNLKCYPKNALPRDYDEYK